MLQAPVAFLDNTMRIIAGAAKGLPIRVPQGEVRPTQDRVREALFNPQLSFVLQYLFSPLCPNLC